MGYLVNRGTKAAPRWSMKWKEGGRWRQRATHQPTRAEAQRVLEQVVARVARGELGIPEPQAQTQALTLSQMAEQFLGVYSRPRVKDLESYKAQAKSALARLVLPSLGERSATALSLVELERWRDSQARAYSPATVNRALAVLSVVFSWGCRQGLCNTNPCQGVERLRVEASAQRYSLAEVHQILRQPDCPVVVATALYTGLRKGELCGLRWGDVMLDGDHPRLEVQRSYSGITKGGRSRVVPLHPELLPLLRSWREQCPQTPEGLVFPRPLRDGRGQVVGWGMGWRSDDLGLAQVLERSGVAPRVAQGRRRSQQRGWHAFRHTFASLLLEASGNRDAVSRLLGHAQGGGGPAVTLGYTHPELAYLEGALRQMSLTPPAQAGVISLEEWRRR